MIISYCISYNRRGGTGVVPIMLCLCYVYVMSIVISPWAGRMKNVLHDEGRENSVVYCKLYTVAYINSFWRRGSRHAWMHVMRRMSWDACHEHRSDSSRSRRGCLVYCLFFVYGGWALTRAVIGYYLVLYSSLYLLLYCTVLYFTALNTN